MVCVHRNKQSFYKALKLCSPAGGLLKAMSLTILQQRAYFESIHDNTTFYDVTRFLVSPLEGSLTNVFADKVSEKPKVSKKRRLRDLTIKIANSAPCAFRGSTGQKP